jgi:hypothetical protein
MDVGFLGVLRFAVMGYKKPRLGRDVHMGTSTDALELYARYYRLFARCRRPECGHRRELHIALLMRLFEPSTTLGQIGARFRCHRCQMRGARIESEFVGPTRDPRS